MTGRQKTLRHALALVAAASLCSACAGFGLFEPEPELQPLPASAAEIRTAIEIERSRLLDLLSEPVEGEDRWTENTDTMVIVAQRIARLQDALEELEQGEAPAP